MQVANVHLSSCKLPHATSHRKGYFNQDKALFSENMSGFEGNNIKCMKYAECYLCSCKKPQLIK